MLKGHFFILNLENWIIGWSFGSTLIFYETFTDFQKKGIVLSKKKSQIEFSFKE